MEKFWLPLNINIDLQKNTQILDANLRPFYCTRFRGKTFIFKNDVQWHAVDNFSRELKSRNNTPLFRYFWRNLVTLKVAYTSFSLLLIDVLCVFVCVYISFN